MDSVSLGITKMEFQLGNVGNSYLEEAGCMEQLIMKGIFQVGKELPKKGEMQL